MYLQPIKNDDPQLDFYTMYKRETTEYDAEYMQKYNEDLNTTLIFVRSILHPSNLLLYPQISVDLTIRPVCFPQSAPPSSLPSSQASSQIPATVQKPISGRSSLPSIDPLFPMKSPRFPHSGLAPLWRLLRPWTSCMQAS